MPFYISAANAETTKVEGDKCGRRAPNYSQDVMNYSEWILGGTSSCKICQSSSPNAVQRKAQVITISQASDGDWQTDIQSGKSSQQSQHQQWEVNVMNGT